MKKRIQKIETLKGTKFLISLIEKDLNIYEVCVLNLEKEKIEFLILDNIEDALFYYNKYKIKYTKTKGKNCERYKNFVSDYIKVFKMCEVEFLNTVHEEKLDCGLAIDFKSKVNKSLLFPLLEKIKIKPMVIENLIYLAVPYSNSKKSQYEFIEKEMKKLNYDTVWYHI